MNNDTKKLATDLLAGWLTAIGQQNKAINRKNKLIHRLRKETEEREQYLAELKREFSLHNTALHTLATAMDVQWGGSVRESVDLAIARIAQLSAEHADMVKRNALLRERPDLPVDRIPAHDELVRERSANDVFVAMLKEAYELFYEQDVCAGASIAHGSFGRRLKKIIDDGPFGVVMPPEPLREGDKVHITMGNGETVDCVVSESITMEPMNVEGTLTGRMKMPLPPAYGDCTCDCHRTPGVMHVMPCCWPGKMSEFFTTPVFTSAVESNVAHATSVVDMAKPPTEEAYAVELEEAEEALGAWMSAALGDPGTCKQMKDDINRWFAAMASCTERYPTTWAYEQACTALEAHRKRADKAEARVREIQGKNSMLYTRLQRHREDINRIRELVERIT